MTAAVLVLLILWGYTQPMHELALLPSIETPALWTHALAHLDQQHLITNLVGFGVAAVWFERRWGGLTLLCFCLGAAPLTALAELAWGPAALGLVGCSGAMCALIGTCWAHSRGAAGGVACMTALSVFKIFYGNDDYAHVAHFTGFALGLLWAILTTHEKTLPVHPAQPTPLGDPPDPRAAQPTPQGALRG